MPSSVLLDTTAKLEVNWLICDATAVGVSACLTYKNYRYVNTLDTGLGLGGAIKHNLMFAKPRV